MNQNRIRNPFLRKLWEEVEIMINKGARNGEMKLIRLLVQKRDKEGKLLFVGKN